ncbi:MAG: putative phospholipid transporter-binding protein MlaD [Verrucomicrobiota bacterium]|jgi:phospholipid/cholesterol/gamma-HCH transport system substrate-binding protein
MKNHLETRLGYFVVLALLAAVLVVDLVGNFTFFKSGLRVHALFANVQDLKPGDAVKMSGVRIGRVDKIALDGGKVKVTLLLDKNTAVHTDSLATIRFTGLMGQNYVAVDFGNASSPVVASDAILVTAEQADLNALMAKLDNAAAGVENLTKSFTGDKIDNLLGPVTDFLKQNTEPLTASIANLKAISTQIASGQGTVGRLIYSNDLHDAALATLTNLQSAATDLQGTIADAKSILSDARAGKGTVGKLITDETLYVETTASMKNLHEVLAKINSGQGTIGKLINDPEFYKNAKLTLQKLDKATDSLEDSGPMSVLGTAAGHLF